jgi:hypothetical protein
MIYMPFQWPPSYWLFLLSLSDASLTSHSKMQKLSGPNGSSTIGLVLDSLKVWILGDDGNDQMKSMAVSYVEILHCIY